MMNKVFETIGNSTLVSELTIGGGGLLVGLQHVLEFCELVVADNPVQVHLLQDVVARQLLATLILEQCSQHPGALLAC